MMGRSFHSIYSHGLIRTAVAVPAIELSDPQANAGKTLELAKQASEQHAAVCLFPELGLTGYTNDDLFHQSTLLNQTRESLAWLCEESTDLQSVLVVGAPLKVNGALYNCGIVLYKGEILGVTPKLYLPNYREFYEKRQFTSGRFATFDEIELAGQCVPFGSEIIFNAQNVENFKIHVEICEDLWVPTPPSSFGAMAGATVLANLSAGNVTIGKEGYRRLLCSSHSGRTISTYLYAGAGAGESTTDLAWDGHAMIYENGRLLAQSKRFKTESEIIYSDVDLDRLSQERMRMTSFNDNAAEFGEKVRKFRTVDFDFEVPDGEIAPVRSFSRFPYVPISQSDRDNRCEETYNIQVQGLYQRMKRTGIEKAVIGISGGLDSTQSLIVTARTLDLLDLPRSNILAYTMPGFATSENTLKNAHELMEALGVTSHEIDIRPSSRQMLEDINHPFAEGESQYDVTFENVQAGDRTAHLFRLANLNDALVIGTGDLSELALGWTTYGIGDHMSHYNVNVSVPKTLIQYLIRWTADSEMFGAKASEVMRKILDTEISPELVPSDDFNGDGPAQSTEEKIGPYELQDFNLYYISRFGYLPSKVAFMSYYSWRDKTKGAWPEPYPKKKRNEYDLRTIKKWLEVFLQRFFTTSQFKRSALPNGPKVGSGGSLSPRGDWRAPSDSTAKSWLDELEENVPEDN